MKEIISTNIGNKRTIHYKGKEVITGMYKYPVDKPLVLDINDVEGDNVIDRRYHGGEDKACYLYSSDYYIFWKKMYPTLDWQWGMFGENLSVSELDETSILIGDIYKIGTAVIQVTQPRQPCFKLGIRLGDPNSVKVFVEKNKPGVYVRVLERGQVNIGDKMELVRKAEDSFSVQQIFYLIYHAVENLSLIKQAIKIPELAESCKKDLIKYAKL